MAKTSVVSSFDPSKGEWQIGWPGRVSRHDLVYLTPPSDPMQGMALGNGDVGVLCWCEPSRIILVVNKCDLWDDAPSDEFTNWKADEEDYSTTLRHGGRVIIDFGMPVFDTFYLSDFDGRLSLADARLSLRASGPLGSVSFDAFVSHDEGVLCCHLNSGLSEDSPVTILVERYGSRTFSHWYRLIRRNPEIGLGGTEAGVLGDMAYVDHQLTSGKFAVGCQVLEANGAAISVERNNAHCSQIKISGAQGKTIDFAVAVTEPLADDPLKALTTKFDHIRRLSGVEAILARHTEAWKSFWLRSFMDSGDDYLNNLWHLTMYYANASQSGKYPGRFIGGLWSWNRDVQQWNFYFHWNQQQTYWPLNAAGHHELCESYLDYRFNSLPHGRKDAAKLLNATGAWVSDVCDRLGRNSAGELHNYSPVAEIALDFWRQYRFTGDKTFLTERALPYMLEAARFFESILSKEEDGKYHLPSGTGYEGWIMLHDPITVIACCSALLSAVFEALDVAGVDDPSAGKWCEIKENLAPLPVIESNPGIVADSGREHVFARGMFKGHTTYSDLFLASGFGIKEQRILTAWVPLDKEKQAAQDSCDILHQLERGEPADSPSADMALYDGIFPTAEYSAVFPSGLIGLRDANHELFSAARNTAKLCAPDAMGWDTLPIVFARLGLAEELRSVITGFPDKWQLYCNGWGHYGPMPVMKPDAMVRWRAAKVEDADKSGVDGFDWAQVPEENQFEFPAWPFRHMGMESMSVVACAMNESLLQSYDGTIRVGPAAHKGQNARLTLHAAGGFVVSSEIKDGQTSWIYIESKMGGMCRLQSPWDEAYVNGSKVCAPVLEFDTSPGGVYLISTESNTLADWVAESEDPQENRAPKTIADGRARLGLPRMF